MPRDGQNPMRWVEELPPRPRVSLTTMVHVPELHGYWSEAREVVALSLESLRATTEGPTERGGDRSAAARPELVVLDNGSCPAMAADLDALAARGVIDLLVRAHRNLGKTGGWNVLFGAARGDVVSYGDSDVYFLPGWLEASLAVLDAFPEAAMVTAQPLDGDLSLHCRSTLAATADDPTVTITEGDDLIPDDRVRARHRALGRPLPDEPGATRTPGRRDVLLERAGVTAYVSSSHFQFTAPRGALDGVFPLATELPLGDDRQLDERLDDAGLWRLSTPEYLVHHMGNRVPDLPRELPWVEPGTFARPGHRNVPRGEPGDGAPRRRSGGVGSTAARRLLKRVDAWTYRKLYGAP